ERFPHQIGQRLRVEQFPPLPGNVLARDELLCRTAADIGRGGLRGQRFGRVALDVRRRRTQKIRSDRAAGQADGDQRRNDRPCASQIRTLPSPNPLARLFSYDCAGLRDSRWTPFKKLGSSLFLSRADSEESAATRTIRNGCYSGR